MAVFDFLRRKNAIQITPVDTTHNAVPCGWGLFDWKRGQRPFAPMYLWSALQFLHDGCSNITFQASRGKSVTVDAICSFLENNVSLMLTKWLFNGFIVVCYDKDRNYWIPQDSKLQFDSYGRVINRSAVVIYSPLYQTQRKNYIQMAKPILDLLDKLANTMMETTDTLATIPVLSGSSIPANPKFKAELAEAMSKTYGWSEDKLRFFLSQTDLKVDSIDLNVKDLELRENINSAFKSLLNYFEIPVHLVFSDTTFNNVDSSRRYFYDNTIRKYAEAFLKVGRNLLTASSEFIPQSQMTYKLTNVSGLETTLSDDCKEKEAYVDVLLKLKDAGVDVTEELDRVYADLKHSYLTV